MQPLTMFDAHGRAAQQDGPASIDLAWTSSHVSTVQAVALACDALAREGVRGLQGAVAA